MEVPCVIPIDVAKTQYRYSLVHIQNMRMNQAFGTIGDFESLPIFHIDFWLTSSDQQVQKKLVFVGHNSCHHPTFDVLPTSKG